MRFSIIVPVYNVEKYIRRCMDSLVNQSFRDYEIIIVDDESPDGSMAIVETYRKKDPDRIRVIHQKNTRQGGARNHGVELALGEYLLFVDSDDYVSTSMLEILDRRLKENPCDILVFQHVPVTENGTTLPEEVSEHVAPGLYHPRQKPEVVLLPCGPTNKAFLRKFYVGSGVRFPEHLLYEDCITRLLYAKAETIFVTEDPLYFYVHRENSSMTQAVSQKNLDIVTMVELVCREFKQARLYDTFREPLEIGLIYNLLCIQEMISRTDPESPMQEEIAACIEKNFPDYGENPYASRELIRLLNCLLKRRFRYYHWRFLHLNHFKEKLLQNPAVSFLNELRKKH